MYSCHVVSNAGPLIWLARCNVLQLLKKLYDTVYIPPAVFTEVIEEGTRKGRPDAIVVRRNVNQGWIKVAVPSKKAVDRVQQAERKLILQIGRGERESIALAVDLKGIVLTNDQVASTVAKIIGVEAKGILFLILLSVQKALIDKSEAKLALQAILREGFWLSPDHVQRFYEALDRV